MVIKTHEVLCAAAGESGGQPINALGNAEERLFHLVGLEQPETYAEAVVRWGVEGCGYVMDGMHTECL